MSADADDRSPFKGLSAFEDSEYDALLFFGREREREIVVANLIASRLTVLYGPSGVGKSSLLHAAVARSLRDLPEAPLVLVFSRWSDDPASSLAEAVSEAAGEPANGSALEALERAQSDRDVYLVLDQAEEYFLYHADDGGSGSFAEALPALLAVPQRVNVLISLREDALAKLDRFTGRIPGLFANTLRLDRLDRESARAAIVRPVERFAELTGEPVAVEPGLVDRVLHEVGTGQIEPALGGLGAVEGAENGARIEAPYLQVVMQRLWEEERAAGSHTLRLETLGRLGGAQHIVEEHLQGAMAELSPDQKDIAALLFNHLVTPSGTKIAHEASDLADFGRVSVAEIDPVLSSLADRRILRSLHEGGGVRYEIFHDVLADPVLAWRTGHEADRELEAQRREADRRHRRLIAVIAVGAVLLAVMGAVTGYALSQRGEARQQAREARASELQAVAGAELARDPELSLLLAREAARTDPGPAAESVLRDALAASRLRGIVDVGEPLVGATHLGPHVLGVSAGGDLVRGDPRTGEIVERHPTGAPAREASFAVDGTTLVTGRDGRARLVAPGGEVTAIPGVTGARAAALSPDATLAAVVGSGGVRLLDVGTGDVRFSYVHPGAISAAISSDNSRVLTGGIDDRVYVWSGRSGRRIHTLTEHTGNAVALAYSPDGSHVASAGSDGAGRLWRTSDWGLASVVTGHTHALTDIGFSADGEHVVTAGKDGTARVSHADTGDQLLVLAGSPSWVTSAAFTGGVGSPVVTAGLDGSIRLWDSVFQPELDLLTRLSNGVIRVEVADDDRVKATARDGQARTVDPVTGDELEVGSGKRPPRRVVGSNGEIATIRGRTVVLRTPTGTHTLEGHRDRVTAVSFSSDGTLLVTASLDHDARIWKVPEGELVRVLQHNTAVHDARFSPDGRWVVTAANRAGLWDVRDGSNELRLQGHEGTLTSATFDGAGRTIVTGGIDGTVRTYPCDICGGLDELLVLAEQRLAATGRELTPEERARYLE